MILCGNLEDHEAFCLVVFCSDAKNQYLPRYIRKITVYFRKLANLLTTIKK